MSARLARDVPGSLSPEERRDSCLLLGPAGESGILWEKAHCRDEWRGMQKEGLSLLGGRREEMLLTEDLKQIDVFFISKTCWLQQLNL